MNDSRGNPIAARRAFAIVPAAGESARMGQPKLLLPWNNSTVIETVLQAWREGGIDKIVVTARGGDMALAELCRRYQADVVVPEVPPRDMKCSVNIALDHVAQTYRPGSNDVWLVAPADLPLLSREVIRTLLAEQERTPDVILVPTHAGRRGHPVLFPWRIWDAVGRLAADEGLNALLRRSAVREIPVDSPDTNLDLDTPADWARLHNRHNRQG